MPSLSASVRPEHHRFGLCSCAVAALALGLLLYTLAFATSTPALRIGLPSLLHTYAFALFGCAAFARSARQVLAIGLVLWSIDLVFETLQLRALQSALGLSGWPRTLLAGTFDPLDLLGSTLGLLAAWATLAGVRR